MTTPTRIPQPRRTAPVVTRPPDREAWSTALDIAGGDARRLSASPDGRTVTVLNQPR